MSEHCNHWPLAVMCEAFEVSRSGYYADRKAQTADASTADGELRTRVKAIHAETGQCYGSRRRAKALQDAGYDVGRHQARRLMQDAGVSVRRRSTRTPQTTESRHGYGVAPTVLNRAFDVPKPNAAWVGDIPYVWTQEGWVVFGGVAGLILAKSGGMVAQSSDRLRVGHRGAGDGDWQAASRGWTDASYGPWVSICVACVSGHAECA